MTRDPATSIRQRPGTGGGTAVAATEYQAQITPLGALFD
jgi:hypothetical protein